MAQRKMFSVPLDEDERARVVALRDVLAARADAAGLAEPSLAHAARVAILAGLDRLEAERHPTPGRRSK